MLPASLPQSKDSPGSNPTTIGHPARATVAAEKKAQQLHRWQQHACSCGGPSTVQCPVADSEWPLEAGTTFADSQAAGWPGCGGGHHLAAGRPGQGHHSPVGHPMTEAIHPSEAAAASLPHRALTQPQLERKPACLLIAQCHLMRSGPPRLPCFVTMTMPVTVSVTGQRPVGHAGPGPDLKAVRPPLLPAWQSRHMHHALTSHISLAKCVKHSQDQKKEQIRCTLSRHADSA
jgi:hypothetical protein